MAESEKEVGGGARAVVGGSLPPRKRLLAGLKQNGLWPAASSQTSPSTTTEVTHRPEEEASEEVGIIVEGVSPSSTRTVTETTNGSCVSCGALESNSWRRVKRNGAVRRVCSSCAYLLNKNLSCLHCQATWSDGADPSVWMQCCKCQRVVHLECERRSSLLCGGGDTDSSLCSECRQVKIQDEIGTALVGNSAPGYVGIVGLNNCCLGSVNCVSSAATESLSPRNKKSRVSKEPPRGEVSWKVAGDVDVDPKAVVERRRPTSHEIAVAAAEEVAVLAGMAAAKAKATAAVKAAAAIKAAAVAKAALDAAALAARADAQVRAQLCRSSWFAEYTAAAAGSQNETGEGEVTKERVEKHDTKIKGKEIPGATRSSIGDEELARQLHRVINSSPRISRGLAPLRRKCAGRPVAAVSSASDFVRVIPRSVLSSPAEPLSQSKQQQLTRPRSMVPKDAKRLEPKFVKQESKTSDTDSCQNSFQQALCPTASDDVGQLVTLKSEPTDSSTVTLLRQEPILVQRQSTRSASPEVLMKTPAGQLNRATQQVSDVVEGIDEVFPASSVSKAAAMLDEVLTSEANSEEPAKEMHQSRSRVGMSQFHGKEDLHPSSSSTLPVSKSEAARELEGQEGLREGGLHISPGVTTSDQVASTGMDPLDGSARGDAVEGHNDGNELQPDANNGSLGALTVKLPRSLSDEFTSKNSKNSLGA
ncbi:unnamed protein product [Calypogeia fissa]